jgi:hypothetical protein
LAGSSLASALGPPLRFSARARMVLNGVTVVPWMKSPQSGTLERFTI